MPILRLIGDDWPKEAKVTFSFDPNKAIKDYRPNLMKLLSLRNIREYTFWHVAADGESADMERDPLNIDWKWSDYGFQANMFVYLRKSEPTDRKCDPNAKPSDLFKQEAPPTLASPSAAPTPATPPPAADTSGSSVVIHLIGDRWLKDHRKVLALKPADTLEKSFAPISKKLEIDVTVEGVMSEAVGAWCVWPTPSGNTGTKADTSKGPFDPRRTWESYGIRQKSVVYLRQRQEGDKAVGYDEAAGDATVPSVPPLAKAPAAPAAPAAIVSKPLPAPNAAPPPTSTSPAAHLTPAAAPAVPAAAVPAAAVPAATLVAPPPPSPTTRTLQPTQSCVVTAGQPVAPIPAVAADTNDVPPSFPAPAANASVGGATVPASSLSEAAPLAPPQLPPALLPFPSAVSAATLVAPVAAIPAAAALREQQHAYDQFQQHLRHQQALMEQQMAHQKEQLELKARIHQLEVQLATAKARQHVQEVRDAALLTAYGYPSPFNYTAGGHDGAAAASPCASPVREGRLVYHDEGNGTPLHLQGSASSTYSSTPSPYRRGGGGYGGRLGQHEATADWVVRPSHYQEPEGVPPMVADSRALQAETVAQIEEMSLSVQRRRQQASYSIALYEMAQLGRMGAGRRGPSLY